MGRAALEINIQELTVGNAGERSHGRIDFLLPVHPGAYHKWPIGLEYPVCGLSGRLLSRAGKPAEVKDTQGKIRSDIQVSLEDDYVLLLSQPAQQPFQRHLTG